MRALVVEDHAPVRTAVVDRRRQQRGWRSRLWFAHPYDVIVLDLMRF